MWVTTSAVASWLGRRSRIQTFEIAQEMIIQKSMILALISSHRRMTFAGVSSEDVGGLVRASAVGQAVRLCL